MKYNRICAVSKTTNNMSLLLFNVYMPCDIRSNHDLYCDIFGDILNECNTRNYSNLITGIDLTTSTQRVSSNFTNQIYVRMNQSNHVLILAPRVRTNGGRTAQGCDAAYYQVFYSRRSTDRSGAARTARSVRRGRPVSGHEGRGIQEQLSYTRRATSPTTSADVGSAVVVLC